MLKHLSTKNRLRYFALKFMRNVDALRLKVLGKSLRYNFVFSTYELGNITEGRAMELLGCREIVLQDYR